ncbi:MAG: hypothetical protein ACRENK_04735 [Gemmatimonadaceae bacterium]
MIDEKRKADAIAAVRRELARRLTRICACLSEEDFNRLLDRMAYVHWKYEVLPFTPELQRVTPREDAIH